jgi:hypothetical protein
MECVVTGQENCFVLSKVTARVLAGFARLFETSKPIQIREAFSSNPRDAHDLPRALR